MLLTSCPTSLHISGGRDKNETELIRALFSGMIFYGVVFVVVSVERELDVFPFEVHNTGRRVRSWRQAAATQNALKHGL